MSDAKGVHEYYAAIKGRLYDYIKSDYLANSETLLLYADDLLGATNTVNTNISREPYIETAASYKKIPHGFETLTQVDSGVKSTLLKLVDAKVKEIEYKTIDFPFQEIEFLEATRAFELNNQMYSNLITQKNAADLSLAS